MWLIRATRPYLPAVGTACSRHVELNRRPAVAFVLTKVSTGKARDYSSTKSFYPETIKSKDAGLYGAQGLQCLDGQILHQLGAHFAQHYGKSPDLLNEDDLGAYLDYLNRGRGLSRSSVACCYSGIKLLWEKVLGRGWDKLRLPRGKNAKTLPEILSEEEVRQLVSQTSNLKHRTMLKVLYATGIRVGELVKLKPVDIDSKRTLRRKGSVWLEKTRKKRLYLTFGCRPGPPVVGGSIREKR